MGTNVLAQGNAAKAKEFYQMLNFPEAINSYEKHIEKLKAEKPDLEVITNLANSYYFTSNYSKARIWYDKIYQMQGDGMSEDVFIRYFNCYRINQDYDRANDLIKTYYARNQQRIKTFGYQRKLIDSLESNVGSIVNLQINTDKADFGTVFYGKDVIFSSTRVSTESGNSTYEWNDQPYLNVYVATQNRNNGQLSNEKGFLDNLNSDFHDACLAFSKDLQTVYFSRNMLNKKEKLATDQAGISNVQIMKGTISGNQVVDISSLNFNGKDYSCGQPMVTPDGKYLIFASNMPGGYGETDLYIAEIFSDGGTNSPINLGPTINTPGREMFPSMSGDTLFFASDAFYGFGGLDIYASVMKGTTNFSIPENLGEPINSNYDDFAYTLRSEDRTGYFSSNRKGGKGDDDIYWFNLIEIKQFIDFSGLVLSKNDNAIIPNADVKLYDAFNDLILETKSNDKGEFEMELPCNAQFTAVFSKPEYSTESLKISTPEKKGTSEGNDVRLTSFASIVEKEDGMEKIKVEPIYFEYNKWDITPQAIVELDKILFAMEKFPSIKIKIESHTDSRGSDSYNLKLSDSRAKSTMEYLISKGIAPERIESAMGYGETKPKNKCRNGVKCSEEEYFINRRSDFIVISK